MKKEKISVIVSCFNESQALPYFYQEMTSVMDQMNFMDFELLFVNDGSSDDTLSLIKELRGKDDRVRYLSFSRNFGKEAAMLAGLEHAKGDCVTLMDADLQDPPGMLIEMYHAIKEEGYDSAGARRVSRKGEPQIRSFFARMFYKSINKMTKTEMVDGARDYRLMKRCVVDSIVSLKEYNRYSKGLFSFVGYETKWLEYENVERVQGETKWSFWKLVLYAIEGIIAFTTAPLAISAIVGLIICVVSFAAIILIVIRTILYGDPIGGWPSMICILLFTSGIQLFCIGIMGQYLAKTYLETKHRPIYIIKEASNEVEHDEFN